MDSGTPPPDASLCSEITPPTDFPRHPVNLDPLIPPSSTSSLTPDHPVSAVTGVGGMGVTYPPPPTTLVGEYRGVPPDSRMALVADKLSALAPAAVDTLELVMRRGSSRDRLNAADRILGHYLPKTAPAVTVNIATITAEATERIRRRHAPTPESAHEDDGEGDPDGASAR